MRPQAGDIVEIIEEIEGIYSRITGSVSVIYPYSDSKEPIYKIAGSRLAGYTDKGLDDVGVKLVIKAVKATDKVLNGNA